jgi:hypothetical protein
MIKKVEVRLKDLGGPYEVRRKKPRNSCNK